MKSDIIQTKNKINVAQIKSKLKKKYHPCKTTQKLTLQEVINNCHFKVILIIIIIVNN